MKELMMMQRTRAGALRFGPLLTQLQRYVNGIYKKKSLPADADRDSIPAASLTGCQAAAVLPAVDQASAFGSSFASRDSQTISAMSLAATFSSTLRAFRPSMNMVLQKGHAVATAVAFTLRAMSVR